MRMVPTSELACSFFIECLWQKRFQTIQKSPTTGFQGFPMIPSWSPKLGEFCDAGGLQTTHGRDGWSTDARTTVGPLESGGSTKHAPWAWREHTPLWAWRHESYFWFWADFGEKLAIGMMAAKIKDGIEWTESFMVMDMAQQTQPNKADHMSLHYFDIFRRCWCIYRISPFLNVSFHYCIKKCISIPVVGINISYILESWFLIMFIHP